MKKVCIVLALVFVIICSPVKSMAITTIFDDKEEAEFTKYFFTLHHNEGPFVYYPAKTGFLVFTLVGMTITGPVNSIGNLLNFQLPSHRAIAGSSFRTFGVFGEGLFAFPFLIVKKTLFDGPIYLWDSIIRFYLDKQNI